MQYPAGWYPDPSDASIVRWWDGSQWTASTQPAANPSLRDSSSGRGKSKLLLWSAALLVGVLVLFAGFRFVSSKLSSDLSSAQKEQAAAAYETAFKEIHSLDAEVETITCDTKYPALAAQEAFAWCDVSLVGVVGTSRVLLYERVDLSTSETYFKVNSEDINPLRSMEEVESMVRYLAGEEASDSAVTAVCAWGENTYLLDSYDLGLTCEVTFSSGEYKNVTLSGEVNAAGISAAEPGDYDTPVIAFFLDGREDIIAPFPVGDDCSERVGQSELYYAYLCGANPATTTDLAALETFCSTVLRVKEATIRFNQSTDPVETEAAFRELLPLVGDLEVAAAPFALKGAPAMKWFYENLEFNLSAAQWDLDEVREGKSGFDVLYPENYDALIAELGDFEQAECPKVRG